jgi:hypothetical protein
MFTTPGVIGGMGVVAFAVDAVSYFEWAGLDRGKSCVDARAGAGGADASVGGELCCDTLLLGGEFLSER